MKIKPKLTKSMYWTLCPTMAAKEQQWANNSPGIMCRNEVNY